MFAKAVILLLLLIVAASLLTGRTLSAKKPAAPPLSKLRPLMLQMAVLLLGLGAAVAGFHLLG